MFLHFLCMISVTEVVIWYWHKLTLILFIRLKGRIMLWRKLSVRLLANSCEQSYVPFSNISIGRIMLQ